LKHHLIAILVATKLKTEIPQPVPQVLLPEAEVPGQDPTPTARAEWICSVGRKIASVCAKMFHSQIGYYMYCISEVT